MSNTLSNLDSSIRHGYAQVGDVRLHYAERGEGEQLIILLHGFPECWYSWRHQLTALGERFRVVAPDMRGYNLSDKPPRVENYRMTALVQDVLSLIRHCGARQAVIVGHDWGAAVAWELARRHPEYVSKLAALQVPPLAAWSNNLTLKQLLRSWYMFFFQLPRVPEWWIGAQDFAGVERMFKRTARRGTFTETDIAALKSALRQPGALTASINYYRANLRSLISRRKGDDEYVIGNMDAIGDVNARDVVRVPTLFIYGERDFAIVPETVSGVSRYVAAPYREVRLANSGHWVQQESPSEVNAALLSFLNDQ